MQLKFNHQIKEIPPAITTLSQLLELQGLLCVQGIAVAVDGQIISRPLWESLSLQPGMDILVITATQGG